jgi:thiol-disulfide isomerase/thioredoxin
MMKKILLGLSLFVSLSMSSQIWSENFNGGNVLPAGWSQQTLASDGGWIVGSPTALSSLSYVIPAADGNVLATNDDGCNCVKANDLLVLPVFDLTATANPYLLFDLNFGAQTYLGNTESLTAEASTDGGASWTILQTFTGSAAWQSTGTNLSDYAGMASVQVGFRYNDGSGWLYGAALDNMSLIDPDLSVIDATVTLTAMGVDMPQVPGRAYDFTKYLSGETVFPAAQVTNNAFSPITSFDISYTVNGNTVTESVTGQSIGYGQSYTHEFSSPLAISTGANTATFAISNVNGGAETVINNNAGPDASMTGIVPFEGRVVVFEEGTGTWCGWCPRGTVFMSHLATKYPSRVAAIAVHNDDPMTVATYDTAIGGLISGYPSGLVDRADFNASGEVDPSQFEQAMMERISTDPGVAMEVVTSIEADGIHATCNLDFTQNLSGDYKLALVLVEEEVTGAGTTWGQTNYYSGGVNGPMGGFEALGATVPAASMVYDHVARELVGGFGGAAGSVPSNPTSGLQHTFSNVVPLNAAWNLYNMHAVYLLIKVSTGEIINAGVSQSIIIGINEVAPSISEFNLFPNPAADQAFIRMNATNRNDVVVNIIDATGKVVASNVYKQLNNDSMITLNTSVLANGIYSVSVLSEGELTTRMLVVNK